jgi:hypothetical protein
MLRQLLFIPITIGAAALPSKVDNSSSPYFPSIISQVGESCASASAVGYVFNYEINALRGVASSAAANTYPYFATYNVLNSGSEDSGTYRMFIDAWKIIRDNGIPNMNDFGTIEPRSTKWMTGYDKYYRAMHNRIKTIDSIDLRDTAGITAIKHWLLDHNEGAPSGGLITFTASAWGVQNNYITTGPALGRYIINRFGTNPTYGPHALTIVGYDDSIRYDENGDGKITTTVDITGDGRVTPADNEFGAFLCANTWGTSFGDDGLFYAPYRLFSRPYTEGGLLDITAYRITISKDYRPRRTFKVSLTHSRRNSLAISVGIAPDSAAAAPLYVRPLKQFTRAGGALPMCGYGASATIELGIDVSDLADSLPDPAVNAAYFLIIDASDNTGTIPAFSIVDYSTATPATYTAANFPAKLNKGGNLFRIVVPSIGISSLHGTIARQRSGTKVRYSGSTLRLYVPDGIRNVELFDSNGRMAAVISAGSHAGWYTLRKDLVAGNYLVRLTYLSGSVRYTGLSAIR